MEIQILERSMTIPLAYNPVGGDIPRRYDRSRIISIIRIRMGMRFRPIFLVIPRNGLTSS